MYLCKSNPEGLDVGGIESTRGAKYTKEIYCLALVLNELYILLAYMLPKLCAITITFFPYEICCYIIYLFRLTFVCDAYYTFC